MIGQEEFKLVQYTDDLTLFVPNIECAELILQLLDRFTVCPGLKRLIILRLKQCGLAFADKIQGHLWGLGGANVSKPLG